VTTPDAIAIPELSLTRAEIDDLLGYIETLR
jgi:hypothetical protein